MLKCWAYGPDDRPSFHFIAEQLDSFKCRSSDPTSDFAVRWSYGPGDEGELCMSMACVVCACVVTREVLQHCALLAAYYVAWAPLYNIC